MEKQVQGSPVKSEGFTNAVLTRYNKDQEPTYYMPVYFRIKVKNFSSLDLQQLSAKINCVLILSVLYDNLDDQVVNYIKDRIVLDFTKNDAIPLKDGIDITFKQNKDKKTLTYTIRKRLQCHVNSNIFYSPFQLVDLMLTINILSVTKDKSKEGKGFSVKFNLMDSQTFQGKIISSREGSFGNYDLADALMIAYYSNEVTCYHNAEVREQVWRKVIDELQKSIKNVKDGNFDNLKAKNFNYAHFVIPLYKHPTAAVATIFLPLWLLSFVSLAIFFQDQNLANRLQSISALLIAFIALIPTIREQIPPSPSVILVQIIVYIEVITSFLCTIHSLSIREQTGYVLEHRTDGLFLFSVIISVLGFVIVVVLTLLHYLKWKPSYEKKNPDDDKKLQLNINEWKNKYCDEYFEAFFRPKDFLKKNQAGPQHLS